MPEIKKYLSLVALGASRDKLAHDLIRAIGRRGCEILECRITPLGDHFSAAVLLSGNWSAMGKMESALPGLAEHLGLSIRFEHTEPAEPPRDFRPYAAEVVAPQQPRLLSELMSFFTEQDVAVVEASVQAYQSGMTGADMCTTHLSLHVPISQHPQTLRDAFMDVCDDLHADGLLDPIKT
ncbi:glycine cleavage system protein R [Salinisphaera sp.]|uniref:glycine cleavage system protein R n=1 Tax=Salinisphaera sp. TaxID=1914330 RepID=UPI002D797CF3|nr:ACT domain-containing protein [Salinisphaera sp.]HET7315080.1 ACT domain-containing protein [Salinisphaera sp.]